MATETPATADAPVELTNAPAPAHDLKDVPGTQHGTLAPPFRKDAWAVQHRPGWPRATSRYRLEDQCAFCGRC